MSRRAPAGDDKATPERAWSYALDLLARRAYTEAELIERLERRGSPPKVVEEILARLRRYRLVDDGAFAEAFVRSQRPRKGSIALRRELLRKGVPEEVAEESLEELDEAKQTEAAFRLLERNAWRFQKEDQHRNRARAFAFLARRGFPAPVVLEALDRCHWLSLDEEEWIE